ncbi:MAG TPA: MATE family efflux transporter, partial [Syntrophales bacterium]
KIVPFLSYVLSLYLASTAAFVLWKRSTNLRDVPCINAVTTREILQVSIPLLISVSMLQVMQWTNTIMLGIFASEQEVGIFHACSKIAALMSVPLHAVNTIAAPKFGEFYGKGEMANFKKVAIQSTRLIFWVSAPILLTVFLFPVQILGLFGPEFSYGRDALLLLSVGQFVSAISGSVGFILVMTGNQRIHKNITLFTSLSNIGLNWILVSKYGLIGAAISTMTSTIFWNLSMVLYIKLDMDVLTIYIPFLSKYLRRNEGFS